MGEAILSSMLTSKIYEPSEILVSEKNPSKIKSVSETYGIKCVPPDEIKTGGKTFETVILAVKPQDSKELPEILRPLNFDLLITILAGIKCDFFTRNLGEIPVLRVMPNICMKVSKSVSGLFANKVLLKSPEKNRFREIADKIFTSCGRVFWAENEEVLDKITAVSGSGPAYVCYFIEALRDGAENLGFTEEVSEKLAFSTFEGTVEFLNRTGTTPRELRKKVSSPGGTTEKAVDYFESRGLKKIIRDAVQKCFKKAKKLGIVGDRS